MQLKNNLYIVKDKQMQEGVSGTQYELELIPSSIIYQAHFPGEPITPGVCVVQMGKELLEDALSKEFRISFVKNVKFLSVLSPKQSVVATFLLKKVQLSEDANEVKVQIIVASEDEIKAKISMVLQSK